jgi:hypothetical protein
MTLPVELLLEIVARSDTRTLLRCAATAWHPRRDILSGPFIDRVTQQGGMVPRCILASLKTHDDKKRAAPPRRLSLVHPATAKAVSFWERHMSPYMSRFAGDLLGEHIPVASRAGFVLLRRRHADEKLPNLCVYDLFTGHRTFFSDLPDIGSDSSRRYHLLTFADGIRCSFLLFAASFDCEDRPDIQVQTATSRCGTWAPAATIHVDSEGYASLKGAMGRDAVVLHDGVMHWLVRHRGEIVTYNALTMEQGTMTLPAAITGFEGRAFFLGTYYSHDGRRKLLRVLAFKGFKIFVWRQLAGGDWTPEEEVAIDTEEKLRALDPPCIDIDKFEFNEFRCSSEGSNTVLMRMRSLQFDLNRNRRRYRCLLVICDLETKEVRVREHTTRHSMLLEIDLPSRLRAMELLP